jgi:hypothetical protein
VGSRRFEDSAVDVVVLLSPPPNTRKDFVQRLNPSFGRAVRHRWFESGPSLPSEQSQTCRHRVRSWQGSRIADCMLHSMCTDERHSEMNADGIARGAPFVTGDHRCNVPTRPSKNVVRSFRVLKTFGSDYKTDIYYYHNKCYINLCFTEGLMSAYTAVGATYTT